MTPSAFAEAVGLRSAAAPMGQSSGQVERAWDHNGRLILKLEGVESISDAERMRGCEICVPYAELGEPEEGEHYYVDLIGCEVVEADTGRELGRVEAIQSRAGRSCSKFGAAKAAKS